ncbi:lipoxygenase [Oculatella sp. LEGE 06141]|uniref:lipoxygenase family protein n=1 Tax=Oculatella sp. LEGE 06141 TaxID=1828648 RepID=UPI00187DF517|nr:lipoxygenase family protein [Oculatella sp. LEGE 06141]MBE9177059.1 lipoxygenase [Oculatella sp. LEGE 06141]
MAFYFPPTQAQGAYRYESAGLEQQGPARLFPFSGEDGWLRYGLLQWFRMVKEHGRVSEPLDLILHQLMMASDTLDNLWNQVGTLLADWQVFQSGWFNLTLPPGEQFNSVYVGDRRNMGQILLAAREAALTGMTAKDARANFYAVLEARGRSRPKVSQIIERDGMLSDREFGRQRIAGTNPMMVRRARETERDQIESWAYQPYAVEGETINLPEAAAQNRLFIVDYPQLRDLTTADLQVGRYVGSPQALFYRAARGLLPVLVQLEPGGKVFTPDSAPDDWMRAKLYTQTADITHHELIDHLGNTHLAMEAFAIATPRQLPTAHPFYRLLYPHFRFLLAINTRGNQILLADDAAIEVLLAPTREVSVGLINQAYRRRPFADYALPHNIASRGLEAEFLPEFPYRDDAQLVWTAIANYTAAYLRRYYSSDQAVQHDPYLQAWAAELGQPLNLRSTHEFPQLPHWLPADLVAQTNIDVKELPDYPRVPEFPVLSANHAAGTLSSVQQLVDVATQIIFTCTAQHAAVNFAQFDYAGYTPNMPLSTYIKPDIAATATDMLPPREQDIKQMELTFALSGIKWGQLGNDDLIGFTEAGDRQVLQQFQAELQSVEQTIQQRNRQRLDRDGIDYPYLLPSQIPNSINI